MDWILNNWNQVQSYNFGTACTGLAMLLIAASVVRRIGFMGGLLAVVFMAVGSYFANRGFYWFFASVYAPPGSDYHPAFTANPAHPDDWRWTIWPVILLLELTLFRLYFHVFKSRRRSGLMLMTGIIVAYVGAGFI